MRRRRSPGDSVRHSTAYHREVDSRSTRPTGSTLGLQTALGQNLGTLYQPDRKTPYYVRWEFNLQRDLGNGWVAQGTYLGSRGRDLPVARQTNNIPLQFLSTSRARDTANEALLSGLDAPASVLTVTSTTPAR